MKKKLLTRQSSDPDAKPQLDAVLSEIGQSLRAGNWSATVDGEYADDETARRVRLTVTVDYLPDQTSPPAQ